MAKNIHGRGTNSSGVRNIDGENDSSGDSI